MSKSFVNKVLVGGVARCGRRSMGNRPAYFSDKRRN